MFSDLRRMLTYLGVLRRIPQTMPIEPFERWRDYGLGAGPQIFRPVVNMMEQHVLPQAFFQSHPAITRAISVYSRISRELVDLWFVSFCRCAELGLIPTNSDLSSLPALRYLGDLSGCTTLSTHQESGSVVHIVTPPEPLKPGDAIFISLCTVSTGSGEVRRCFTLEKSHEQGVAYFCELCEGGGRANFGPTSYMSADEFAGKSRARMLEIGA